MEQRPYFNILDSVDSTNNYAMAKVHEGLAIHGMAVFAHDQNNGKGQRGKDWISAPGQNIILTVVIKPHPVFRDYPFIFSAFIANCCQQFLREISGHNIFIKWPNDLYWRDRKAGGILIENVFGGIEWKWAVIGIGININQTNFSAAALRPVSLAEITGENYDPLALGKQLHNLILKKYNLLKENSAATILSNYNKLLYKKDTAVKLRKGNAVFNTTIKEVNEHGQLITEDVMERIFAFGEVEWVF
jgi:BirA family transcriptional regulator, biotin operon repressor / biotin---[acetyl-CoA-carboxylase] ligase